MIRSSHIIPRNKLFDFIDDKGVVKVEVKHRDNHNLNDPSVCKVHIYHRWPRDEILTIGGCCRHIASTKSIPEPERGLVASFGNVPTKQFIRSSNTRKLCEIANKYNVNIGISKKLRDFVHNLEYGQWQKT